MSTHTKAGALLREAITRVIDLYNENYLLVETDIATIESLKDSYVQAKKGQGSYAAVFNTLAKIFRENENTLDKETCRKCKALTDLKRLISDAGKDAKTLVRAQKIKSDYSEFLDENALPTEFRKWTEITTLPHKPEFNYWYHPRLMFAKFDPPTQKGGIVWDDRSGKFVKVNEAYNQTDLVHSDKFFQYNPSTAGFILNKVTKYLNDYDDANGNEEGQMHALDRIFIMLFSYFDLMGTPVNLQDLITSDDSQTVNLYCALLRNEDVAAIAEEDGTTVAKFNQLPWLLKWYTLAIILTRSLYDPVLLGDLLRIIKTWKGDKSAAMCARSMYGGDVSHNLGQTLAKLLGF